MHPLHDYFAKQLGDKLSKRGVVVWYDPRREFAPFIDELRGGARTPGALAPVRVGAVAAQLGEYDGSMFELRALAEPHVAGDVPGKLVLYVPGVESAPATSVLLELELAGERYEPQLRRLARHVLAKRYTDGVVDELLGRAGAGYAELAQAAADDAGGEPPSILKTLFRDAHGGDAIVTGWLASTAHDEAIVAKDGVDELVKLVRSRLGLELPAEATVAKLRAITLRYVLGSEFRADLRGAAPASLDGVPVPKNGFLDKVRACAAALRREHRDAYERLADTVEHELRLHEVKLDAAELGSVDTFRFEERALLAWCDELIAGERHDEALAIIAAREHSYWLELDHARKALWEAARRMAELGRVAAGVRAAVATMSGPPRAWVEAYTAPDGWHRLDHAQRRLEAWQAHLQEECAEAPLAVVRRAYDDACRLMTEGFTRALAAAQWSVADVPHQTRIWADVVSAQPRKAAYFLVDAMRFEMGVELVARLPRSSEVALRAAIAALPSITPVGMSALMPGASASYSVRERGGKLGGQIDDAFLPDVAARKRHAAARIPDLLDLELDEVLTLPAARLAKKVGEAQVIIVRSTDIDKLGEGGMTVARPVMNTVIDNLARAVRRLAAAGVEHAVISADHGYLFFAADRDASMRIDAPGGETIELHRRCWIGRGGRTPAGCVRVAASALGYDSDLDVVFPMGAGVFKAGGDLSFHHGGPSLQEMVVPVVVVRTKATASAGATGTGGVVVSELPAVITAQTLSCVVQLGGPNLALFSSALKVRPILMAGNKQVGAAGMAVDAAVVEGCVMLEPRKPLRVMFLLADPGVTSVRIVVQNPATDAELCQSTEIPVRLGV